MVDRPIQLITNAAIIIRSSTNIQTIHPTIFNNQDIVCIRDIFNNFCFLLLSARYPSRKPFNGQMIIAATGQILNANVYLFAKINQTIIHIDLKKFFTQSRILRDVKHPWIPCDSKKYPR